jgi:hypothetical protein
MTKISELDDPTSVLALTDLFAFVEDPGGTPKTVKDTFAKLRDLLAAPPWVTETADFTVSVATHAGKIVRCNSSSDITVTVPVGLNSGVATFTFVREGTGHVRFEADGGATLKAAVATPRISARYGVAQLLAEDATTALLFGQIEEGAAAVGTELIAGAAWIMDARAGKGLVHSGGRVTAWVDPVTGVDIDTTTFTVDYNAANANLNGLPTVSCQPTDRGVLLNYSDVTVRDWTFYYVVDALASTIGAAEHQVLLYDVSAGFRLYFERSDQLGYFSAGTHLGGTPVLGPQRITFVTATGTVYVGDTAVVSGLTIADFAMGAGTLFAFGENAQEFQGEVGVAACYPGEHDATQLASQWAVLDNVWGTSG